MIGDRQSGKLQKFPGTAPLMLIGGLPLIMVSVR